MHSECKCLTDVTDRKVTVKVFYIYHAKLYSDFNYTNVSRLKSYLLCQVKRIYQRKIYSNATRLFYSLKKCTFSSAHKLKYQ